MSAGPTILLVGTADTKSDELAFMRERLQAQGAGVLLMDVGVLAAGHVPVDIANHAVAAAAGHALPALAACGDEHQAMTAMAAGAATIAARLQAEGRVQGLLALGGTMGTDLAFDVAAALPLGVPKVVVSTVAYSHLIPPERITPDLIMVLWAGGLYGLNSLCRSALAQGCGAVVGAAAAALPPRLDRPLVGITSLGQSCLAYMVRLKPALEARGCEVAVFHTTGMGGRAFESLAAAGRFAAVMDFSLQELANHLGGSVVTAGADRLTGAGRAGTPQLVAPGAVDMVDFPAWQPVPASLQGRAVHVHNRLIASATSAAPLRRAIAAEIGARLARATGPTCLLLPLRGIEQWDRPGEPMHDPEGLATFVDAMRAAVAPATRCVELDAHINDAAFCDAALEVFDGWVAQGLVRLGRDRGPGAPPRSAVRAGDGRP
ncbi:Tm-1-like ATP-binding domain-containing protein [Ideonella sp. A 288]|uniref:Tm-1-like ATP-binding domain-containing protein n=1 Tax=Ideonella sp. A 288 TaxID=1962181 RepID=UPI000B4B90BE|nr:Tm-1-like ATP-binding domain-containing protein [Ideonella sp. A 288]